MRERCTEPLGRPFECWFGVGQPDGHHSMVWKIWAARKTADLYIAARSMGGAMKASLHASGKRNVGLTSEYVRSLESRQSWHGGSRHYDSWEAATKLAPALRWNSYCGFRQRNCGRSHSPNEIWLRRSFGWRRPQRGRSSKSGCSTRPPKVQWALNYRLAVDRRSFWREGWRTPVRCC